MKHIIFLSLVCALLCASCSKKDSAPAQPSVAGYWEGTYKADDNSSSGPFNALFRKDGTVRLYDRTDTANAYKADGTYSVSGATINFAVASGVALSAVGTTDAAYTTMDGTFGETPNTTGSTFQIAKKQ